MYLVRYALWLLIAAAMHGQTPDTSLRRDLEHAIGLQKKGETAGARRTLQTLIPRLRDAGHNDLLARALVGAGETALTSGDYAAAIQFGREAVETHSALQDYEQVADDWNRIGLANIYRADYPAAIAAYEKALAIDRQRKDIEGEVVRLYNIGNVYFEQGRYQEAYRNYRASLDRIEAAGQVPWSHSRRQIAVTNLAILSQRLGRYQQALDLYLSLDAPSTDIPPSQRAQVLANKGALYRRLGDAPKALQAYREAQKLFEQEHHPFGEIGVLKNIGIALALDLHRLPEAVDAFEKASRLSASSAKSQLPSIQLYLAEALRQMGRVEDARREFQLALESARSQGSKEYTWRALFGLGQLTEQSGRTEEAFQLYEDAIRAFESLRSGIDMAALKREFLADKREVYDAAIHLVLERPEPSVELLFRLMENSRSRILQDSLGEKGTLKTVQDRLPENSVLLEFWQSRSGGAVLCITKSEIKLLRQPAVNIAELRGALLDPEHRDWQRISQRVGEQLLSGVPVLENVMVVADGALSLIPFEALFVSGTLLLERAPVFYVPSAGVLLREGWQQHRPWRAPWQNRVAVLADPVVGSGNALVDSVYARLPHAEEEARYIASASSGRSELHTAADAQKGFLQQAIDRQFPLLHISSHATADYNDPERSRILFAPAHAQDAADFLFLREVYSMNLKSVDLIVLSACDTEIGKEIRGEGIEGFGKAFITAGASSSITTLWRVDDGATAQFMKQFYYHLGSGMSKAQALREAKLKFLRSGSPLAHPAYWAAFVLNGDGNSAAPRFVSWPMLIGAAVAAVGLVIGAALWVRARSTRSGRLQGSLHR